VHKEFSFGFDQITHRIDNLYVLGKLALRTKHIKCSIKLTIVLLDR